MTPVRAEQRDRPGGETGYVVTAHTNLSNVERGFRSIKVDDLDLRPSTTDSKTGSEPTS